ncbi:MAG: TOBE domain-containing protein, partial [Methylobacteriaceae bacterium]|nr:TOBE domain-containing protein [Methylobacteriaceae bacterium]
GRVTWIERLGDQNHLHVAIEDQEVVTLADPDSDLAVGDDVGVRLVRPLFFDADGVRINA